MIASGVNWVSIGPPREPIRASVRIRNRAAEAAALLTVLSSGEMRIEFEEPQPAITPGQAAVFYDGDAVVGGGWIKNACDG